MKMVNLGGFQQKCFCFVQEKVRVDYHSASKACSHASSHAAVAVHMVL